MTTRRRLLLVVVAVAALALCGLPGLGAAQDCSSLNDSSCEKCLKNVTCLWCNTNSRCMDYPVKRILPHTEDCALSAARWGVCWVNFEALIIAMSVVGGILLLGLATCCYCCCRSRKSGPTREDVRLHQQQEERRAQSEERRADRKARHDEIRKKYGLIKDDHAYSRLASA
ncbi:unnamed protein product [Lampetra planeri]